MSCQTHRTPEGRGTIASPLGRDELAVLLSGGGRHASNHGSLASSALTFTLVFAAGALAGACALLAFGPGGDEMRRALRSRARYLRDVIQDVEIDVEERLAAVRDRRAGRSPEKEEHEGPFDSPAG